MNIDYTGIAVIIDDRIGRDPAIDNIIKQIKKRKIPYLEYEELPYDYIKHFGNISFLILDWVLVSSNIGNEIDQRISISDTIFDDNIDFLKKLMNFCFVPIFIFTNEAEEDVISYLTKKGLYDERRCNRILVKNKSELSGENNKARKRIFLEIEKWTEKNSSVYVLKKWEEEFQKAKNTLFSEFFDIAPHWPNILWKNYKADGVNASLSLQETITRNIFTRIPSCNFSEEFFKKRIKRDEDYNYLLKVLEGERLIPDSDLHNDSIEPGDIFNISNGKLFINIRPICDTVNRNGPNSIKLYLLKGSKLDTVTIKTKYSEGFGRFHEQHNEAIITPIKGATYSFKFRDLKIEKWNVLKDKRIGRLLPPYITSIQQRYALYLQRQGLPRVPKEILGL